MCLHNKLVLISLTGAALLLFNVTPLAWGEEVTSSADSEVESKFFAKLQTGYQSLTLNQTSNMSGAWDVDLGVGVMFTHLLVELNLGLSLSLIDYQRSPITKVSSYMWEKAEALGYYKLSFSKGQALLIGGGVGYRHLDQRAEVSYLEGDVIKIMSNTTRALSESTISTLIRAGVLLNAHTLFMLDYDISPLQESKEPLQSLGVNLGYVF